MDNCETRIYRTYFSELDRGGRDSEYASIRPSRTIVETVGACPLLVCPVPSPTSVHHAAVDRSGAVYITVKNVLLSLPFFYLLQHHIPLVWYSHRKKIAPHIQSFLGITTFACLVQTAPLSAILNQSPLCTLSLPVKNLYTCVISTWCLLFSSVRPGSSSLSS